MGRFSYTDSEKEINKVLKHQDDELKSINKLDKGSLYTTIMSSEKLLNSLGRPSEKLMVCDSKETHQYVMPSWEELCAEVNRSIEGTVEFEDLFSKEELVQNAEAIRIMQSEYSNLHRLDKYDYAIAAAAAILSGATDILLVGIPHSELHGGEIHRPLSDCIRKQFEEHFPAGELETSIKSKVPYDAQDNRNTKVNVEGLSSYYHRLLSLGHDPLLGFIVGVFDIMTGRMTTIDKLGHFNSQVMDVYSNRVETNLFEAIAKQVIHLKSDITTSMGLPVPLMALFDFLQIGEIGEEEKTIAEIVQEMYHEGYDFIHFCSMSIPMMIAEVTVRLGYAYKRRKEGHSLHESIPFSKDREKCPKLSTMLFIAHSGAVAINTGKLCFTKDPCAINYAQWMAFAKYSYRELKWAMIEKPKLQANYVTGIINEELNEVLYKINDMYWKVNELPLTI